MKILIWAPHGCGEHYWGPGISAYRLYKSGLPVNVDLYLAHGYKKQKDYPNLFKGQFYIKGLSKNSRISQLSFLINSYIWINRNYSKFDIVHVLGLYEIQFRPAIWFEAKGIPAICKVTGEKNGIMNYSKFSKVFGIAKNRERNLNTISGYIALSEKIIENLKTISVKESKIIHISNGVNTEIFKPLNNLEKSRLKKKLGIQDKFTVLFVGGISKNKQPHILVNAIKNLIVNEKISVQLIILGPASDEDELKRILDTVDKFEIGGYVKHITHSNEPEMFYQISDLFCLPSQREGMSNALLEAMSSGLPSLVTPVSGSAELISDNVNGFHVSNTDDISNRIFQLYKAPGLIAELGKNARNVIEKTYKSEIILKQHLDLFDRYVQSNNRE